MTCDVNVPAVTLGVPLITPVDLLIDSPPGSPDAVYVKGVLAPPIEAAILRLTALPVVAVWGGRRGDGEREAAVQHAARDRVAPQALHGERAGADLTFPAGSLSPQSWPPQAHLSATSPPLVVSALSTQPVPIGSVMASISSCPPVMGYPSFVCRAR